MGAAVVLIFGSGALRSMARAMYSLSFILALLAAFCIGLAVGLLKGSWNQF